MIDVERIAMAWNGPLTLAFQDAKDLVAGDRFDLSDTMRVAKGDANLRGSHALAGKFDNLVGNFLRSGLFRRETC
jgi:hypothetical protein